MNFKYTTTICLMLLLCANLALAQYTINYSLDGGTTTNPSTYEQTDIATTVTIGVYELVNGSYVEKDADDLVYVTGISCQTWSRSKLGGGYNYNAATEVSYDVANSSITWTEYGPEASQAEIEATCAAGMLGVTKTVVENEYLIQDQGVEKGIEPFYLGIKTVEFSTIELTDATKNGYTFNGWFTDSNFVNQITEISDGTTGDIDLYAKYTAISLGVSSVESRRFNFSPNPNTGIINTELELSNLKIINPKGILVSQFTSNQSSYDISNLESGFYILQATDIKGVMYTAKLIKK